MGRQGKIFAENRRKPQIGVCHLKFVTLSAALGELDEVKKTFSF